MTTVLLDSLLHHAVVMHIKGASYRLRGHTDLTTEHARANAPITPPPPSKRRGRPPEIKNGAASL
ncbi:ATP-binding protein [Donghicola eburneus]|uniref:ATP-binding protein n=1 Tax=Donghicola eburneus TaxID=393278 RepID=UPI0023EA6D0A|nr:ATP-binding protein [Donghicola eburneus]